MYLPESTNGFAFLITYDITDIIIVTLAMLALVGFIFYRKNHSKNKK